MRNRTVCQRYRKRARRDTLEIEIAKAHQILSKGRPAFLGVMSEQTVGGFHSIRRITAARFCCMCRLSKSFDVVVGRMIRINGTHHMIGRPANFERSIVA